MTEKITKPEIIVHSPFHGTIQGVNFSKQQVFTSIEWFLGEFENDDDVIKRKMLLETEFIEELDDIFYRDYYKNDYEYAEIEQGLYDLFSKPVAKMEVDYSRTLSETSQENVIETRKKLRQYLKQLKLDTIQTAGIVLYENIKIDSNLYEVRELSTKQYESIKSLKAPSLFILLDQKLNLAYGSWNNGQPELVQLTDARIFDSIALDTILKSLKEEGISLHIALLVPKK